MTDREIAIYLLEKYSRQYLEKCKFGGFSTTYPKTEAILENVPVNGVSRDEIIFMVNMKRLSTLQVSLGNLPEYHSNFEKFLLIVSLQRSPIINKISFYYVTLETTLNLLSI